jgi:multidrug efflux pump subunit AcrB
MLIAVNTYKSANINTSLVNLCVFVPLLVLPGITGKFLSFIPITIFTTLLGSLLMSLTVNNALFYKLNKPRKYYFADSSDDGDDDVILSEIEQAILDQERIGKRIRPASEKPTMERVIDKMIT